MKKVAILVVALAALAVGCHKHVYNVGDGAPSGMEVYDQWHDHWFFGLINTEDPIDVRSVCPSGNATVTDRMTFVNGLINALIGIVYSPTTVTIRCDSGAKVDLNLSEDAVARIVSDPRFLSYVSEVAPELLDEAREAQRVARTTTNDATGPRTVTAR